MSTLRSSLSKKKVGSFFRIKWTKEKVEQALALNTDNRKMKRSKIREYSSSLRNGDWCEHNGDTIRFYSKGRKWILGDGQNRLMALESGLEAYEGKPLLNSVTGEDERLEMVLPLVKKYGAAVIGISNDETGISEDPDVRFAVAKKIVERAQDYGIPRQDVLIDPLVMPIGALRYAGRQVFHIVRRCREELDVNTCCGASNVSFGLPQRPPLSGTFLAMAIGAGMTSAITNPIEHEIKQAIMAANVMMGNDENCMVWIAANRPPTAEGEIEQSGRRERRSSRRGR